MSTFNTATIIHIDEFLSDDELESIERELGETTGVLAACVHKQARHLMVIDYDPMQTTAENLLNNVHQQGLHAELIGGI